MGVTSWTPVGYARFATLSSAITLGTTTPTAGTAYSALVDSLGNKVIPIHAIVDVESQNVRARSDGTAPTATEGQLIRKDAPYIIEDSAEEIRKLQLFEAAASASVTVRYFI